MRLGALVTPAVAIVIVLVEVFPAPVAQVSFFVAGAVAGGAASPFLVWGTIESVGFFPVVQVINLSSQYREYFVQAFPNCDAPRFFPAFKRLAMIYEKKGMLKEAIEVCVIAIDMGFDDDRTVGMMYGRIAKLCKASGLTVDDKYLYLS